MVCVSLASRLTHPESGLLRRAAPSGRVVEEWNGGDDEDGVPFREKIYAVFPGFEPSLKDGRSGLHLMFLFDPEIGRANYLKAFDLVMGGVSPWSDKPDNQLKMSNKSAEEAFPGSSRVSKTGMSPRPKMGASSGATLCSRLT